MVRIYDPLAFRRNNTSHSILSILTMSLSVVAYWFLHETFDTNPHEAIEAEECSDMLPNRLRQINPKLLSTYRLHKVISTTDSLESYRNWALRESITLKENHRQANKEIRVGLLRELSVAELKKIRTKCRDYLRKNKMPFYATFEFTRKVTGFKKGGKKKIKHPTDRMHGHYLLDTDKGKEELEEFFNNVCFSCGLSEGDFDVRCREIPNPKRYAFYLTKYKLPHRVILAKKNVGFRKTSCSKDWWIDANGNITSRKEIWKGYKAKRHEQEEAKRAMDIPRYYPTLPTLAEIGEVLAYGGREASGQLERLHEEIQSNIDRTGECPEIRYMIDVFDSPTGEGKVICRTHHYWEFECSTPRWGQTTATVDIWVAVHGQDRRSS